MVVAISLCNLQHLKRTGGDLELDHYSIQRLTTDIEAINSILISHRTTLIHIKFFRDRLTSNFCLLFNYSIKLDKLFLHRFITRLAILLL